MTRELDLLVGTKLQRGLKLPADTHQDLLALLGRTTFATSNITITAARNMSTGSASPDTDTIKGLAHVDNNAHDLTILFLLERLADGRKHGMHPELVDVDGALILELV